MDRQNVTLSLPKALLKKAKTLAIRKDRSLSDLLRGALEEKVKGNRVTSGRGTARLRSWRGVVIWERMAKRLRRGTNSMQGVKTFVDTNVLVLAYDVSAGGKHETAVRIMRDLWNSGNGVISLQVLQEFFITVTGQIAEAVERYGYTQRAIARHLGMHYSYISLILRRLKST